MANNDELRELQGAIAVGGSWVVVGKYFAPSATTHPVTKTMFTANPSASSPHHIMMRLRA